MKRTMTAFVCLALAGAAALLAESTGTAQWDGVWQGELDGVPSVTLTVAHDTGQLSGTLVLNLIKKENGGPARIAAVESHALVSPRVEANTLDFAVRKHGSGDLIKFTVSMAADGTARIHCTSCGDSAPVVEIAKQQ